MKNFSVKQIALVGVIFAVLIGVGVAAFVLLQEKEPEPVPVVTQEVHELQQNVIGTSVQGRDIESYTYLSVNASGLPGRGNTHLAFVGGVHGGYEWNSVLLAYEFIDYLNEHPTIIPKNITVTIIPSANPDGVYKIIGKEGRFVQADVPGTEDTSPGRFNANNVDLNRNFNCKWQSESTWRSNPVSAGTAPFSEPEAAAIRNFVEEQKPTAVVFWHSKANTVYASECENGILAETLDIMNVYAKAAGYSAVDSFDAYEITGDAEGWLASIGIPAITVELQTHETIEWERNLAGVTALFNYYKDKN